MVIDAVKNGDTIKKNILKLVISEIQNLENHKDRKFKKVEDQEIYHIIKQFIKNNNETIALSKDSSVLVEENNILQKLLPEEFTESQLYKVVHTNPQLVSMILSSKNNGQAMGIALKTIKSLYQQEIPNLILKNIIESLRETHQESVKENVSSTT